MQQNVTMESQIEYIVDDNTVTVIAYKSYGTTVMIPEKIGELTVTKIGAYAFSNIERSKELVPSGIKIYTEIIAGVTVPGSNADYICGRRLEEIYLPKTIEIIDQYAFYDCRELKEMHLWGGKIQIENGVFMNCEKLSNIFVEGKPDDTACISGILDEISEEVCVTYTRDNKIEGVFVFPEYYEDSVENTPARVLHYLIHGAGYRYRQCFENNKIHIFKYDMVFHCGEIQGLKETALQIAYLRLLYPYQLQKSLENKYLEFITLHRELVMKLAIEKEDLKIIVFLTGLGILTEDDYKTALEQALRLGKKECASIVLKEKLHYYPPIEKKYEF